jgi:hypothetical protein
MLAVTNFALKSPMRLTKLAFAVNTFPAMTGAVEAAVVEAAVVEVSVVDSVTTFAKALVVKVAIVVAVPSVTDKAFHPRSTLPTGERTFLLATNN